MRPVCLASYSFSSARRNRSVATLSTALNTATPMLTVTGIVTPRNTKLWAAMSARRISDRLVASNSPLHQARELAEHVIARQVAVLIVDALEEIDVEHEQRQWPLMAACPHELSLEGLVEVPAVVHLGEAVGDGELEDLFEVRALGVCAREILEDRRTDLDAVTVGEHRFFLELTFVVQRAVSRTDVHHEPTHRPLFLLGVTPRHRVVFQNHVVVRHATDGRGALLELAALPAQPFVFGVDHDQ